MSFSQQRRKSSLGKLLSIVNGSSSKADIQIEFTGPHNPGHTWKTGDAIGGSVSIFASSPLSFDDIEIALIGQTRCIIDRLGATPYSNELHASHTFMKLVQPVPLTRLVTIRDIPVNESRSIPFTFVVPSHALPTICRHHVASHDVREAHLLLPPSLGSGNEVPAEPDKSGVTKLDDFCPPAISVTYTVRVRLLERGEVDENGRSKPKTLAEEDRKIRIIPAIPEAPPINVQGQEDEYCLRKVKTIKKGMFKGVSGELVIETTQPPPLRLPAPDMQSANLAEESLVNTVATVALRYEPKDPKEPPPKLGNMTSKLKVLNFYHSYPLEKYPIRADMQHDNRRQMTIETLTLSSRTMASAQWYRQEPEATGSPTLRHTTSGLTAEIPHATTEYSPTLPYHTAHLLIPITLPPHKHFAPTFHSCLISRVYILELSQDFRHASASSAAVAQSATLRVPIQILSEPRAGTGALPTPAYGETDEEEGGGGGEEEMGDYFTPRMTGPPPPSFGAAQGDAAVAGRGNGDDAPPDYSVAPPPPNRDVLGRDTEGVGAGWRSAMMPPRYSGRAIATF